MVEQKIMEKIMDKPLELTQRTKEILACGKELRLIYRCNGQLTYVLHELATNTYGQIGNADENTTLFTKKLNDYLNFYNEPDTRAVIPFFGIEVTEEQGEIKLTFAK